MVFSSHLLRLAVGLFLTALMASCEKSSETVDAAWWRLEGERAAVSAEVELAKQKLARVETKSDRSEAIKAAWVAVDGKAAALETRLASLRSDRDRLAQEVRLTREQGLAQRRQSRVGDHLESLSDNRGREFRDVRISQVTESGIEFRHSTGLARLTAEDLGVAQREAFGIDRERSMELVALERQQQATYRKWADQRLAEQAEEQRDLLPPPTEVRTAPVLLASSGISTLSQTRSLNPLHQSARPTTSARYYNVFNYGYCRSSRPTPFVACPSPTRLRTLGNSPGGSRFNYSSSHRPYVSPCIYR